jgi:L-seryl-tRNA(Ser) seleniumtransferase
VETTNPDHILPQAALRELPSVHVVLEQDILAALLADHGRDTVLRAVRAAIDEARIRVKNNQPAEIDASSLARRAMAIIQGARPLLRPVINATGILLHTGLGRAPLAEEAVEAVTAVARGYCNLEFELEQGERGRRTSGVARLLREITGAEAATVVNNNAGATVLALRALAAGREVIVSRGQLVEIGGSFRLPEILEVSGARLREVGTTNKTRLTDYERAINPDTAAILRVHHSNFRIVGFTEEAPLEELVQLAHDHGLFMIDDIGSGALSAGQPPELVDEPHVAGGLAAGADLVLFSGDKLLGGPQCGILVGTARAIARVESDPLMRALRVDKLTLAALEATLNLVRDRARGPSRIPLWEMLTLSLPELRSRADHVVEVLRTELSLTASVIPSQSFLGGGSVPVQAIPTLAVSVSPPFPEPFGSEGAWARALRLGDPPVVPRVQKGAVLFDLRTVASGEDASLLDAVRRTCHDRGLRSSASDPA